MRYLITCDFALTFVGGAQNAMIRQAEALHAQGDDVLVVAANASKINFSKGIQVIEPPKAATLPNIDLPVFRNNAKLRRFARETIETFKADAVLSHSEFSLVAALTDVARELGVPTLHTVHTFFWNSPAYTAVLAPLARAYFRFLTGVKAPRVKLAKNPMDVALRNMTLVACQRADVTISPSHHQAAKLEAAGLTRVEVVSNVTETSGKPTALPAGEPLKLAWIARFSPEKRLDIALEAAKLARAELADSGKSFELHIAGGAPRESWDYNWHGILKADGVSKLLTETHALIVTSLGFDNQPMVVLEAFSHGRGVILSDPVLGKEFGPATLLTPTPDSAGLAKIIVEAAHDRSRLERAGEAATEAAKMATSAVHARRMREITEAARR